MTRPEANNHRPPVHARTMTRREFLPRLTAAALGAGGLLSSGSRLAGGPSPAAAAPGSMNYRTLGKTGIRMSEIGFGSHLTPQNQDNPAARAAQIRRGLELGINVFDIYEHGYHQFAPMSEALGADRQKVLLSLVTVWDAGRTMAEVEFALETFDTDVIDLYCIYWASSTPDSDMALRFEALREAKEQGKIRAVGLVSHDHADLVERLRAYPDLDFLMLPYNFRHQRVSPSTAVPEVSWGRIKADRHPLPVGRAADVDCQYYACQDAELLPLVRELVVGLIAIKPFAGGGLLQLPAADPLLAKLDNVEASFPQAALRFALEPPEVCSVIPAMNYIREVDENVGAANGGGLSAADVGILRLYAEAAERVGGGLLPEDYRWLEEWRA